MTTALNIVINDAEAVSYRKLLEERFPHVSVTIATERTKLEQCIGDADVILASRWPLELLDRAKKLRWFQCTTAGVDFMLPYRDELHHIAVTNSRGIQGEVIADYVMAGVTMLHWDFRSFQREQEARKWSPRSVSPLSEKTLGVVGLGSIGSEIARRAKGAGMTVLGSKRDISGPVEGVDKLFSPKHLGEFLPLCDFVVLAVPSTPETIGLIGINEIADMRQSAFLVNIARGNVVVEHELIKALQAGTIAGAMLDVFEREPLAHDSELWGMENVIITPHVAGWRTNYIDGVFAIFADNIERFHEGRKLNNMVNLAQGY